MADAEMRSAGRRRPPPQRSGSDIGSTRPRHQLADVPLAGRSADGQRSDLGEAAALYRLMAGCRRPIRSAPSPIRAASNGRSRPATSRMPRRLRRWLAAMIRHGSVFCDAVHSSPMPTAPRCDGDDQALAAVAELAAALAASQGALSGDHRAGPAFLQITRAAWPCAGARPARGRLGRPARLSGRGRGRQRRTRHRARARARGLLCRRSRRNLISAGVRLVPLGQTDGQRVLAALERAIAATARSARSHRRSTISAARRSAPTSPACATRRSTPGCSAVMKRCPERFTAWHPGDQEESRSKKMPNLMVRCASASAARSAPARPR